MYDDVRCPVPDVTVGRWYRCNVRPTSNSLDIILNKSSLSLDRNPDGDYSSAYVTLYTSDPSLVGHGMTFTIGRGNDIVSAHVSA